ncbi:hypothetical protein ACFQ48_01095 [Hymenobacter caeli]|uniref:Septal ring factor EnvC (AmiA/AmiB activator) n=1 Tax=Hymenobacter caeli TaxID=2735894 RepID=A0ABX2FJX4_9BACT|nr:hypothetical protein [Hymenobacter caeli]NRT17416.1 septal ring factor EnvC (AmiA/AmiB activator) [Hymenobacter caeli]
MKNTLLLSGLLALLATGCQSSSAPDQAVADEPTTDPSAPGQNMMQNNTGMMAQNEQLNHLHDTLSAPGAGPRARAMRLHEAAMNRMEALGTERQRLAAALAKLSAATPAGQRRAARLRRTAAALQQADDQMMAWMHDAREPDSTKVSPAQVAAYWQQQLPVLKEIDQRTTAALDSAKALK